jgi:hypothetical protein
MATATQTTKTVQATEAKPQGAEQGAELGLKGQHSLGALFATTSENFPFTGIADAKLLEAMRLTAPEGQEWRLFAKAKVSKKGKPFLSVYIGLSDIDR